MEKDYCQKRLVYWGQHGPVCWFNALLVGMFYSQYSRSLLLEKIKTLKYDKENEDTLYLFTIFDYILNYKYVKSKNYEKDVEVLARLKPDEILKELHKYNKELFYINKSVGHRPEHYLKPMYNLFNVDFLMLYELEDNKYVLDRGCFEDKIVKERSDGGYTVNFKNINVDKAQILLKSNPEVLCLHSVVGDKYTVSYKNELHNLYRDNYGLNHILVKNPSDIKNLKSKKEEIVYNGEKYVLDSVIIGNFDSNKNDKTGGHAVVGIKCNNNKYVYNGWMTITDDPGIKEKYIYNKNNLDTPCDLMKYNWDVNNKDESFCLNWKACKLDKILDVVPEDMCFSFAKGYRQLIYIKKSLIKDNLIIPRKDPKYYSFRVHYNRLRRNREGPKIDDLLSKTVLNNNEKSATIKYANKYMSIVNENKSEEKVNSRSAEKVNSRSAEKVNSRSAEKVNSRSADKVNSRSADKVNSRSAEEKIKSRSADKVKSKSVEKVNSRSAEKVNSRSAEKVNSRSAEKVNSRSAEKVKSKSANKVKSKSVEKVKSKSVEKVKSKSAEKVNLKPINIIKNKSIEKIKKVPKNKIVKKDDKKEKNQLIYDPKLGRYIKVKI